MSRPKIGLHQKRKENKSMSKLNKEFEVKKIFRFSDDQKRSIIEDYLRSGETKQAIWKKYTGRDEEHGMILHWMRRYGYVCDRGKKRIFAFKKRPMKAISKPQMQASEFENLQLKRRILELEKQLKESEMKGIAWQTMVEIAEREFNISIKKKFNTKSLNK
jgi:hypothetical protein